MTRIDLISGVQATPEPVVEALEYVRSSHVGWNFRPGDITGYDGHHE